MAMSEVTFQPEDLAAIATELALMLPEHYRELALNQDRIPLDPDWERYFQLAEAGLFKMFTVRAEGQLIGYWGGMIQGHLHYKSTLHAGTDLFWLSPEWRKNGIGTLFFQHLEAWLRSLGVQKFIVNTKAHAAHQALMVSLGFTLSDLIFIKMLDPE